jgi:hypothetical protein
VKRNVRNPARLALFFSCCFVILLLIALMIRFLELRTGELRALRGLPETKLPEFISALRWALAPALYISVLLGLSYSSRRKMAIPLSFCTLFVLSLAAVFGLSQGLERLRELSPPPGSAVSTVPALSGEKGLILSQAGASIIILRTPEEVRGPRVAAIPGQPLAYQEQPRGPNNTVIPLPPLPFRNETSPFLNSLFIDFSLSAGQFEAREKEGLIPLGIYAAALILFLVSLRFILDIGNWPLASLFLGALAFRGVLAFDTFLNSGEIQDLLASFVGDRIPLAFISPLVFCTLGLLVLLYTALVHLVKDGRRARNV